MDGVVPEKCSIDRPMSAEPEGKGNMVEIVLGKARYSKGFSYGMSTSPTLHFAYINKFNRQFGLGGRVLVDDLGKRRGSEEKKA